ncbi:MAG: YIP1 family protein, partial [Terriglobales bacterium]
ARIVAVFASPSEAFADIAREPHFILAWCAQAAAALVFVTMVLRRVGAYALAHDQIMQSARNRTLPPEQLQAIIAVTTKAEPYILYLIPIFGLVTMLFMGWIFQGISNFLLGHETRFKSSLSMVSHAYLAQSLYWLLVALVVGLMADPSGFVLANPISTNMAFFLDKATAPAFLYQFSLHLDLFALWTVVLLALGLAKLGGKRGKFGAALAATGSLWLLYCLVAAGFTAAFS